MKIKFKSECTFGFISFAQISIWFRIFFYCTMGLISFAQVAYMIIYLLASTNAPDQRYRTKSATIKDTGLN